MRCRIATSSDLAEAANRNMNEPAAHSQTRWFAGAAALLLTAFVTASVSSLMNAKYPAIGAASLVAFALVLSPLLAIGLVFGRGKFRAFCIGAALPALAALLAATSTLESLFKNLPPTWPPSISDFDEQTLIEANRRLGTSFLAGVGFGYFCVMVVWLAERLRQAGICPRPQFGLKTVFVLMAFAGFVASAAARISPENETQFYFVAFCAGCVAIVALGLYIAALLVPPIQVRAAARRSDQTERLRRER
jgi:hypothetical protein